LQNRVDWSWPGSLSIGGSSAFFGPQLLIRRIREPITARKSFELEKVLRTISHHPLEKSPPLKMTPFRKKWARKSGRKSGREKTMFQSLPNDDPAFQKKATNLIGHCGSLVRYSSLVLAAPSPNALSALPRRIGSRRIAARCTHPRESRLPCAYLEPLHVGPMARPEGRGQPWWLSAPAERPSIIGCAVEGIRLSGTWQSISGFLRMSPHINARFDIARGLCCLRQGRGTGQRAPSAPLVPGTWT
jgi:hypothetical protein